MIYELCFDSFGWWDRNSKNQLTVLKNAGNKTGWFGVTHPSLGRPQQTPMFVSGANTAGEAIAAGMPTDAATNGSLKTPAMLLD